LSEWVSEWVSDHFKQCFSIDNMAAPMCLWNYQQK
jgi:hypothetical protein